MSTPSERFAAVLTEQYTYLFEAEPASYGLAKARYTPKELAEKMTENFKAGTASKDGDGIKRTCKVLGIRHTYAAIEAFISQE